MKHIISTEAGDVELHLVGTTGSGKSEIAALMTSFYGSIEPTSRLKGDPSPGTTIVGYRDEGFVYLLPDIVLREISKTHPLRFTKQAIGDQLREEGLLIPGKDNLTVQRSLRGNVVRLWRMKAEISGCEDCESCDDNE